MSGFINYICDDVRDIENGIVNVYKSKKNGCQEFGAIWTDIDDAIGVVLDDDNLIYRIRVKWKGLS